MKKTISLFVVLLLMLASFTAGMEYQRGDVNQDGAVDIADVSSLIDFLLYGSWSDEPVTPEEPQTETFTVNGVSFTMVTVEGGTFVMGASDDDAEAEDREKPAHEVTLSSYSIGETEVTQALWQAVMGSNPSFFTGDQQCPVEQVSWNDCQTFIAQLNQLTGRNFRLPSEAEWEFAARGGNLSQGYKYAGSNTIDEVAWYGNNNITTHPVATKAPNELGLYDMSGNVWELCQDYYIYTYYSNSPAVNPTGPLSGSSNLRRGGSVGGAALTCRVSGRYVSFPSSMSSVVGLRLALDTEDTNKFRLSETVITVFEGESKTVEILDGDGGYTTEGGSNYVTSTINGNNLTVTGTQEGTTTVHVTNTSTGAITILTVIVMNNPNVVDGHEYVDLGLPSGTLWATCNVGANSPEEYGDYFAWGETETKDVYSWETYKWCNGTSDSMTKYCSNSSLGTVDGKAELEPEDDPATVYWGEKWRTPTNDQIKELINKCTWTWTTQNGVNGYLIAGPNGNTLFLPAAGERLNQWLYATGTEGYYWSRTVVTNFPNQAYFIDLYSGGERYDSMFRYFGISVRPVHV